MTTPAERSILAASPAPTAAADDPARLIDDRERLYDDESRLPERRLSLGWIDGFVRHRRVAFVVVALVYVLSFNGLWRVGVDSALYRGLAHSLATGQGYQFNGEPHRHAFFGVPYLLAGCERLFGPDAVWVPQLIIVLMALATVALTYRLILLHFPLWVATFVAVGVGTNFRFARLAQELMTDVPFALGVVATLYGLERLRMATRDERAAIARALAMLTGGLLLAAATRPTIGVLAGAIVAASLVRAVRNEGGRRGLHVAICAVAAGAVLLLLIVDPRTRGFSPGGGVYERELIDRVGALPTTIFTQLDDLLSYSLNDAFFSQKLQPFSIPVALLLLAGSVIVMRRNLAWGLMVVGVVAVTLPLSTAPRYYLMVLPILWLGWLLLLARVTLASPAILRGAIMMIGVAVPLGMNLGRDIGLIAEQRAGDVAWLLQGKGRTAGFYAAYRDGEVPRLRAIADLIKAHALPGQRVVGPDARILVYYSGRRVESERELFEKIENSITKYPALLEQYAPDLAIFPALAYGENDRHLRDLVRRRILSPTGPVIGRAAGKENEFIWLAKADVRPPPPGVNWKTVNSPDELEERARDAAKGKPKDKRKKAKPATVPAATIVATQPGPTTSSAAPAKKKSLSAAERAKRERAAKRAELVKRQEAAERRERAEAIARRERAAKRAESAAKAEQQAKRDRKAAQERRERNAAKAKKQPTTATTTPATATP